MRKTGKDQTARRVGQPSSLEGKAKPQSPWRRKRESHNASYIGGGDLHCLTYTDDQSQWITMLEKVGPVVEQSNMTELWMESGAASLVGPCRMTAGCSCGEALLKATEAQAASQGMLNAKCQLVEVHGEKITVRTMFELVSMKCPILSVGRLVGKEVVVVMENERRYKSYKNREIPLHKFNGVFQVNESQLAGLYSLKIANVDEPPAATVRETTMPWTR